MPALRPASWILAILGLLIVGCSGGKGDATSPIAPTNPLAPAVDPLVSPDRAPDRATSNVIEGEVILAGSAGGSEYPEGPQSIDVPITGGPQFGIVELEATTLSGVPLYPAPLAYAGIGHAIGAYSTVPPTTGHSNYGIPRTDEQRTFARHFPADGALELRLSNQQSADGPINQEPIRWKYRIATTPDPPLVPNKANKEVVWPVESELNVNEPTVDTLARGYSGRNWQMRRRYRVALAADSFYNFSLRPLLAPLEWTWQLRVIRGTMMTKRDIAAGEIGELETHTFDQYGTSTGYVEIWAATPFEPITQLEVGSYELTASIGSPKAPAIEAVQGFRSYYSQEFFTPMTGLSNVLAGEQDQLFYLRVDSSGCPCTYSLQAEAIHSKNSGDPWTDGNVLEFGEPGEYVATITATNAVGTSAPITFPYHVQQAMPQITLVHHDASLYAETEVRVETRYSVTDFQLDFGPHAIPRYSNSEVTSVSFRREGIHEIHMTATNARGQVSYKDVIAVETPLHASGNVRIHHAQFVSGVPGQFSIEDPYDNFDSFWWEFTENGESQVVSGPTASIQESTPGLYKVRCIMQSSSGTGPGRYKSLQYVVHPSPLPIQQPVALPRLADATNPSLETRILTYGNRAWLTQIHMVEDIPTLAFLELDLTGESVTALTGWDAYPELPLGTQDKNWKWGGNAVMTESGPCVFGIENPATCMLWQLVDGIWTRTSLSLPGIDESTIGKYTQVLYEAVRWQQWIVAGIIIRNSQDTRQSPCTLFAIDSSAAQVADSVQTGETLAIEFSPFLSFSFRAGASGVVCFSPDYNWGEGTLLYQPMSVNGFASPIRQIGRLDPPSDYMTPMFAWDEQGVRGRHRGSMERQKIISVESSGTERLINVPVPLGSRVTPLPTAYGDRVLADVDFGQTLLLSRATESSPWIWRDLVEDQNFGRVLQVSDDGRLAFCDRYSDFLVLRIPD